MLKTFHKIFKGWEDYRYGGAFVILLRIDLHIISLEKLNIACASLMAFYSTPTKLISPLQQDFNEFKFY